MRFQNASDAILEQVNLLLLSKSEIYFDFPAGITISIVGNYQAAGNYLLRNQQSAVSKLFAKSNQLMKIYLQERFSNPSVDSSNALQLFLLFFSLDLTASELPRFLLFPDFKFSEDLDCGASEIPVFTFSEDWDCGASEFPDL